MPNPFEKRATEYYRDDEAFLAVVTPEPVVTFFKKEAQDGRLYDRLTTIIGTPGSGKTTLARLFEFNTLQALLRNRTIANHKPLIDALTASGAIRDGVPALVGARLPLEAEYREFWEFPYSEELKIRLMIAMLQARTVLAWLRKLQNSGRSLGQVEIVPRPGAEAALTAIGGRAGTDLRKRALDLERAIYGVSAALVPPDIGDIDRVAVGAYRPFDVIEAFRSPDGEELRPLVILDDAHSLHPAQFKALTSWLAKRELRVSRWVLTRLDMLTPGDVLLNREIDAQDSGLQLSRDATVIRMQGGDSRINQRLAFRKMAKDMANRYLGQMDAFRRRGLLRLGDLLSTRATMTSASDRERLARRVEVLREQYSISQRRCAELEGAVDSYLAKTDEGSEDLRLAILVVLLERYAKRIPQRGLFEDVDGDVEPARTMRVDASLADGARIHLLHEYRRPYYFGVDALCDASSENAEQFLQLTARLVSQSETQLIRGGRGPTLTSRAQHKLLRERATEILREWDFPEFRLVRRLADGIARDCLKKSLEGNAPLGGGATAFGIPQEELGEIPSGNPTLARVLQFGVAYNAFDLVSNHRTKNRSWCLVQLGGILLLHHGLTLRRGGFLERRTVDLVRLLGDH